MFFVPKDAQGRCSSGICTLPTHLFSTAFPILIRDHVMLLSHKHNFTPIAWHPCKMRFPKGSWYYRDLNEHSLLYVWKPPLLNAKTAVTCLSHVWGLTTYFELLVPYYFRKSEAGDFQVCVCGFMLVNGENLLPFMLKWWHCGGCCQLRSSLLNKMW